MMGSGVRVSPSALRFQAVSRLFKPLTAIRAGRHEVRKWPLSGPRNGAIRRQASERLIVVGVLVSGWDVAFGRRFARTVPRGSLSQDQGTVAFDNVEQSVE